MPHDQDPAKWEHEILHYEKQDRKKSPPENPVLFLGSSSVRLWRLKKFFPDHHSCCLNRGFGGSGLPDVLHFFDRLVTPYQPKAMVFYAGENDIGHGSNADVVIENCHRFVERLHHEQPRCELLILPIKPSPTLWGKWLEIKVVNEAIAHLTEQDARVETVDTATPMLGRDGFPRPELYMRDHLHMSPVGYALWTDLTRPWLERQLASAP